MLHAYLYPGSTTNLTDSSFEWKDDQNQLHNVDGPAKITPLYGGCNRVQFFVSGRELSRTEFKFFYPDAKA